MQDNVQAFYLSIQLRSISIGKLNSKSALFAAQTLLLIFEHRRFPNPAMAR